jgi:hypothetical protein
MSRPTEPAKLACGGRLPGPRAPWLAAVFLGQRPERAQTVPRNYIILAPLNSLPITRCKVVPFSSSSPNKHKCQRSSSVDCPINQRTSCRCRPCRTLGALYGAAKRGFVRFPDQRNKQRLLLVRLLRHHACRAFLVAGRSHGLCMHARTSIISGPVRRRTEASASRK